MAKERAMEQHKTISSGLISWLCFVVFLTWVDWIGFLSMVSSRFTLAARVAIYLFVALCAAVAVLRAFRFCSIQRTISALSLIWLLVLPFVPWDETKVMVSLSGFLVPGMTKVLST
jgi:apolipoprotein N-acyltransferase